MAVTAFLMGAGDGETMTGPVGGPATIKARAEGTGGTFALVHNIVPPQGGPPLHVHAREDEMWYILAGHVRFIADGELFDAPRGAFMFVPRGMAHTFQSIGPDAAEMLVMFTPAGMERFFEQHAKLPPGPVDPDRYREIARSCRMEVVGPTLAESHPL